jgi:hypothetical protein
MQLRLFFAVIALVLLPVAASADIPAPATKRALNDADRMFLARQFIAKIKPGLAEADRQMKLKNGEFDLSNLPEGEELFFKIRLTNQIALDYQLLAVNQGGHLMLSFKDFMDAVQFPIVYDPATSTATGWYIRENKRFDLNMKTREVTTDHGVFKLSSLVKEQDGDIAVPSDELARWFDFDMKPNVGQLEIRLTSKAKLPIQEKIERGERNFEGDGSNVAQLPLLKDEQKMIDVPFVDVTTQSRYRRPGDGSKPETTSFGSVRTAGDFAKGTLTTQTGFSKQDKITSVRATYKKESLEPELLGPLKARRFEIGDITPVDVPVTDRYANGTGVRVTNKDPLRIVTGAYTDIVGSSIPGWDVELYRQEQLLGIQTVGEDGQYRFSKVDLYGSDNNFRVVMYGLQGEVREEQIYIPVDNKRLADSGSAYDVSLVRQDTTTYNKYKTDDKDNGAPSLTALYEVPVGDASALTAGLLTRQDDGNQKGTGILGLSTTVAETLLNINGAVDSKGEMAGEFIARKDIDKHQFRNETRVATDRYDYETPENDDFIFLNPAQGPQFDREVFGNEFSVNGPLGLNIGQKPHYNLNLNYGLSAEGLSSTTAAGGISASISPLSFNQQLVYTQSDAATEDTLNALTNINGSIGRNRIRVSSDYEIKPENKLQRVAASVNRYISPKMDAEAEVQHLLEQKYTEVSARLNWDTGYGNISPGLTYNSDQDVIATLTTRFGLARDPRDGSPKIFDRQITTNGGVSAFVFLDKNGDNVFNEGDEPIPDAIIKAPQNGGREITDEKGQAFFSQMGNLRLTDVYVDPNSLADPYWVSAYEGSSVLPREGHVIPIEFPVHMSGELDGTVYGKGKDGTSVPVKSVSVGLYDKTGKKIQGVNSEQDGFYVMSRIPPGSYYLVVDDPNIGQGLSRPLPQLVTIGYEGTTIYGNNIYLKQGAVDVPFTVLSSGLPYDAEKAKAYEGRYFALNLGRYKSRLAMGLAWLKVKALSGFALSGTDLIEKPSESLPHEQNAYVLRLSVQDNDLVNAYKKCGEIAYKGNYCSVEILSGGLDPQIASRAAP